MLFLVGLFIYEIAIRLLTEYALIDVFCDIIDDIFLYLVFLL